MATRTLTATSTEKKRRKPPSERRDEIVRMAGQMALADGLGTLTTRNVATKLGVAGSLIGHYFPVIDDLIAEAFTCVASEEMDMIFAEMRKEASPPSQIRVMLSLTMQETRDPLSLFWLDAWHTGRRNSKLLDKVASLMRRWEEHLSEVIREGVRQRLFNVQDPMMASLCILTLIDSLSLHAAMRPTLDYQSVSSLMMRNAERELGLSERALESK